MRYYGIIERVLDMKTIGFVIFFIVIVGGIGGCWAMEKNAVESSLCKEIIIKGNNQFALELYGKLRSEEGNLFFSPYSISTALALTFTGARGRTESQMTTHRFRCETIRAQFPNRIAAADSLVRCLNSEFWQLKDSNTPMIRAFFTATSSPAT